MTREALHTKGAPAPVGAYSQGVAAGGWLFVSGQIPIEPESGQLVDGPFKAQVQRVFENIRAILAEGGAGLEDIVKTTVYLTDLKRFSEVNEVFLEFFPKEPPARAAVELSRLPMDASIEIECIALRPE